MYIIGKIENKLIIMVFATMIIALIGYLDYITGSEFGFSFFYLIPISLLSLYRGTRKIQILYSSVFASFIWFIAEIHTRNYSLIFFPIWNSVVRLIIYLTIGLLFFYLKEKDKRLNQINDKLKAINEEKNRIIGIAAHDLRSPLSAVFSFSETLIKDYKDKLNPEVHEILNLINKSSENTLTLLENLLDISKIESGKIDLRFKSQDYISFIQDQISLNQILAKKKNISISFNSKHNTLITEFDEHYLSEVVNNLLSNAIKYSYKNTGIKVVVSVKNDKHIFTEIIDEGIGIPDAEQNRLFEYFQKTSSTPTDGEKSTGLGLAIAKKIVTLHNGQIGVMSNKSQGSNFFFYIPIKQELIS